MRALVIMKNALISGRRMPHALDLPPLTGFGRSQFVTQTNIARPVENPVMARLVVFGSDAAMFCTHRHAIHSRAVFFLGTLAL
jgi:hypothetical protein